MTEREFKSASEAVEFYREQVRTQNGYAMQQRLRAEQAEAERDRLVQQNSEAVLLVAQLRADVKHSLAEAEDRVKRVAAECARLQARNGRLRKSVNWLRGYMHDAGYGDEGQGVHNGTVDDCDVWECQRARDILAEDQYDADPGPKKYDPTEVPFA